MMSPEGKVKADIKAVLDALGCWYFMPVPTGYGRKGIPDFIGCYKGMFFSIEAKAPGKLDTLTPWQRKECDAIYIAGGLSMILDTAIHLKEMLKEHAVLSKA